MRAPTGWSIASESSPPPRLTARKSAAVGRGGPAVAGGAMVNLRLLASSRGVHRTLTWRSQLANRPSGLPSAAGARQVVRRDQPVEHDLGRERREIAFPGRLLQAGR